MTSGSMAGNMFWKSFMAWNEVGVYKTVTGSISPDCFGLETDVCYLESAARENMLLNQISIVSNLSEFKMCCIRSTESVHDVRCGRGRWRWLFAVLHAAR